MVPIIEEFRITREAIEHIQERHGVSEEEALEAAESCPRHGRTYGDASGEKRYAVAGKTTSGRRLWVVFGDEGHRTGRIITAYEPVGARSIARHRQAHGS